MLFWCLSVCVCECVCFLWYVVVQQSLQDTPQWSHCDGHLAFRRVVPAHWATRPFSHQQAFVHTVCWPTITLSSEIPASRKPLLPTWWGRAPLFSHHGHHYCGVGCPLRSACPLVLGKSMQILQNPPNRCFYMCLLSKSHSLAMTLIRRKKMGKTRILLTKAETCGCTGKEFDNLISAYLWPCDLKSVLQIFSNFNFQDNTYLNPMFSLYEKSNRSPKKIGGGLGRKSPLMTGQLKYRVKIQSAFDIL